MKIMPINNTCQQNFGARLPKSEFNTIVDSALRNDKNAGIPKLYTLLEKLDKMPGEKAELKSWMRNNQSEIGYLSRDLGNTCQLRIDGKLAEEGSNIFDVLYSATTSAKTKDGKKIPMPKTVFDLMWWENRDKTAKDIEQILID